MRFTDGVIALPILPLLIILAAVDLGKLGLPQALVASESVSLYRIVLLIALVGWTTVARLVRGATLSMKTREFVRAAERSEEHTSELQSLMRSSYAVFCLKKKKHTPA